MTLKKLIIQELKGLANLDFAFTRQFSEVEQNEESYTLYLSGLDNETLLHTYYRIRRRKEAQDATNQMYLDHR